MSRYWNDYLMHYGVIGMKWGVRKYQNDDGTLTPAGRKRYNKANTFQKKQAIASQVEGRLNWDMSMLPKYNEKIQPSASRDEFYRIWDKTKSLDTFSDEDMTSYSKALLKDIGQEPSKEAVEFVKGYMNENYRMDDLYDAYRGYL